MTKANYKGTATQETLNVLGSLARQLVVESEKAFKALKQFLRSLKSSDSNAKLESDLDSNYIKDLIRCLGSAYDDPIIIVDGLGGMWGVLFNSNRASSQYQQCRSK